VRAGDYEMRLPISEGHQ